MDKCIKCGHTYDSLYTAIGANPNKCRYCNEGKIPPAPLEIRRYSQLRGIASGKITPESERAAAALSCMLGGEVA